MSPNTVLNKENQTFLTSHVLILELESKTVEMKRSLIGLVADLSNERMED